MDIEAAKKLVHALKSAMDELDGSIAIAKEEVSKDEFVAFRSEVGNLMGGIADMLTPIYKEHPSIAPDWFNEPKPKKYSDEERKELIRKWEEQEAEKKRD